MAESYRGLTIRIGGDTTKLSKALRSANGAISQTDAELRKLGQALRLDPSNAEAYNLQIGYMGDKASSTAMKLAQLKATLDDLGSERKKVQAEPGEWVEIGPTFAEHADSIRNVAQQLSTAKTQLGEYTHSIAEMHTTVTNYAKDYAKIASEDLAEKFDLSKGIPSAKELSSALSELAPVIEMDEDAVAKLLEALRNVESVQFSDDDLAGWDAMMQQLVDEYRSAMSEIEASRESMFSDGEMDLFQSAEIDRQISELTQRFEQAKSVIIQGFGRAYDSAEQSSAEATASMSNDIQKLLDKALSFKGVKFTFENGTTDVDFIRESLEAMAGALNLNIEDVDAFANELQRLVDEFGAVEENYKDLLKVQKFQDLQVEIIKTEATIKSLAKAMEDMKVPSALARGLMDMAENVRMLEQQVKQADNATKSMVKILNFDPSNIEAMSLAMRSLVTSETATKEEAANLRQQIEQYRSQNIDALTDSSKSAAQQLFDAAEAAAEADANLATLNGKIARYQNLINIIKGQGVEADQLIGPESAEMLEKEAMARVEAAMKTASDKDEANAMAIDLLNQQLEREAGAYVDLGDAMNGTIHTYENVIDAEHRATEAAKKVEDARMRVEFEKLQAQLVETEASVDSFSEKVRAFSESFAESSNTSFLSRVFGSTDDTLDFLDGTFSALQQRVKVFAKATEVMPDSVEAAGKHTEALSDAISVGVEYASKLRDIMESIEDGLGTAGLEGVFDGSESAAEAVRRTESEVASLVRQLAEARDALSLKNEGDDDYRLAVEHVRDLENALEQARVASANAAAYERWEEYGTTLAKVETTLTSLTDKSYEFANSDFLKSARSSADEFAKSFSESAFDDIERQVSSFDKVIADAKARVKSIDAEIDAGGGGDNLIAERMMAIEVAADAADSRTKLLMSTLESLGGIESLDDMRISFGPASELGEEYAQTLAKILALHAKIDQYANDNNLGKEWADGFKDLDATIDEVPQELDGVRESMAELSDTLKSTGANLGIATEIEAFDGLMTKVHQTGEVVRREFEKPVKVKVELDDSLSSMLDETSKQLKEFGFNDTGIDELLVRLNDMGESVSQNRERFESLKKALKDSPNDQELFNQAVESGSVYMESLKRRIEEGKDALKKWDESKIDKTAISAGTVGENLKAAQREFDAVQEEVKDLEKKLREAKQALADLNGVNTDKAEAEVKQLNDQLEDTMKRAAAAENALNIASNTKSYAETSVRVRVDEATAAAVKRDLDNNLKAEPKVDDAAFQQALQQVAQYAERAGRKIVESANTIDSAYRDMRKTVNGTEEQFASIKKAAEEFSQTSIVSADQMLEMEALGGQLGVTADALQSFGENASNLFIATDYDSPEQLALALGQITNVMSDLNFDTFDNFADALVRLGNNTATTETGIMNVAQRMAAVANVTSMSTPELLAWSAAIASTGQRSESAATAISNTITGIGKAVSSGGETLQQFATIAGMTADEFEQKWATSSSEALEAFIKGLADLSDDSTAAINALDSVGISSVRQETALLGLSQTVDNLSKAMTMSKDAFNGVDDQWGAAGDAAREAARKSEGFSGSLQILKNNAAVLAASLGDSLVPAMNVISSALQGVTNFLNALPGPMRGIIVAIGGTTIALGALLPVINQVAEGWEKFKASMAADKLKGVGNAIVTVANYLKVLIPELIEAKTLGFTFAESIDLAGTSAAAAAPGISAVGASLASLGVITAVVAVVGLLVTALGEAHQRAQRLADANEKLAQSSDRLKNAAAGATGAQKELSDSIVNVRMDAEEAATALEEMAQRQDALAASMENRNSEFAAQSELVSQAKSVIDEYANSSNLSYDAQAQLVGAVQMLNKELGSSYEVVDAVNGIIREQGSEVNATTSEIDAYIDKQMQMAESEAIIDNMKDAYKALWEAEDKLKESEADRAEAMEALGAVQSNSLVPSSREYVDASTNMAAANMRAKEALGEYDETISQASGEVDRYKDIIAGLEERYQTLQYVSSDAAREEAKGISDMVSGMDMFTSAFDRAGSSSDEFAQQIVSLNGTTEQFGALTQAQLVVIAQAYDGSIASIKNALSGLGIAFKSSLSGVKSSTITPEVNTKPSEDALRNFKNEQEATYTAAKREQEDYYNNEKAMRDHAYDDYKRQLDNEYDSLKTNLDHEYDARKSELDKEYSEAKSASDKYLKQFKAAQDQAVKDFKAATDERLEILKKEYETKKKLIEDETTSDTSDVDDRINALKAETQAEKDADEQRKRQDKVSELATNVARAKTAKKRAEAEKALNEYIAEIEQENRQRSREDLIEALEDEKDAIKKYGDERQQILTDSYNKAVEKYKTMREQQLEVLTAANEAEYEQEKELESAKLENRKAANDAELKSIKENNDAILKSTKDANDIALKAMKEQHDNELTAIKRETEDVLSDLKNSQEAELALYKETGRVAREEMSANAGTLAQIAQSLWESGRITGETYQAILQGLPEAIGMLFTDLGTTVDGGLAGLAQMLLDSGQITRDQYNQIIGAIPTDAASAFTNAGVNFEEALSQLLTDTDAMNKYIAESPSKYSGEASKSGAALGKAMADSFKGSVDGFEDIASGINAKTQRGLAKDSDKPAKTVSEIVGAAVKTADGVTKNWDTVGGNYTIGLANGIGSARGINAIIKSVDSVTAAAVNRAKSNLDMHSPSRVMRALGIYIPEGLALGIDDGSKYVDDAMSDMSSLISDAQFADINQQIVDSMQASRDKLYAELREQADRMARILEDGFDPRLTVDAAYEAMDRIDEGRARMRQATQQITNAPVININNDFTGITVRDETDIDALSAEFERRMRRIIASQIG